MARSRKDAWLRDEQILALDLYLNSSPADMFSTSPSVPLASIRELSELLRALPIEQDLAADPGFRSVGS